jgi:prepilin signal peptidase PulO-like enzyme (type II secretory pathway)
MMERMFFLLMVALGGGLGILTVVLSACLENRTMTFEFLRLKTRFFVAGIVGAGAMVITTARFERASLQCVFVAALLVCLGVVFETDRRMQNVFLLPVLLFVMLGAVFHGWLHDESLQAMGVGALLASLFFGAQHAWSRGRMLGLGDVWFGIALGFFFGWSKLLFVLLLAYVGGTCVALVLLLTKRRRRTDPFPLGACLAVAAAITIFLSSPWQLLGL